MNSSERNISFDLLRIISAIGVIVMHVTALCYNTCVFQDTNWYITSVYNSLFHYGVPIFVMISGALFLNPNREINIRKLYTRNILRLVCVYLVWSAVYGIYDFCQYKAGWKFLLWEIVTGRDHLWFLPMIIGIYMILPILSAWIKNTDQKVIQYFLCLFFVFQILCETINELPVPEILNHITELRNIELVLSYVGYFVAGYYIVYVGFSERIRWFLQISGIILGLLSIPAMLILSNHSGYTNAGLVNSYSIFTFFYSISLFTFFYSHFTCKEMSEKKTRFISNLGKDTLGVYAAHIAIIELLQNFGYTVTSLPLIVGIPIYVIVVYIIGTLISAVLRRIPVVGRYIC